MFSRPNTLLWSVFAALLVLACTEKREISLHFPTNWQGYYQGFRCTEPDEGPAHNKAITEDGWDMNLIVDFVSLGGLPSCRFQELVDWCEDGECSATLVERRCIRFPIPGIEREGFRESLEQAIGQLDGEIVANAPDYPLIVRIVATVESCEEALVSTELREEDLIGCMYSCPTRLDDQMGPLVLDLDANGTSCWDTLTWCASPDLRFAGQ
jgi:hypothetical protein